MRKFRAKRIGTAPQCPTCGELDTAWNPDVVFAFEDLADQSYPGYTSRFHLEDGVFDNTTITNDAQRRWESDMAFLAKHGIDSTDIEEVEVEK